MSNHLYKKDNNNVNSQNNPFENKDGKFHYCDLGIITKNLVCSKDAYSSGYKLYSKQEYHDSKIMLKDINGGKTKVFDVSAEFSGDSYRPMKARIIFTNTKVLYTKCYDYYCHIRDEEFFYMESELNDICYDNLCDSNYIAKGCKHIVALLYMFLESVKNDASLDSTNYLALNILEKINSNNNYKKNLPVFNSLGKLKLIPILNIEYVHDSAYVTFKVGYDKLYVIQSISEFLIKMKMKTNMTFGTKTVIYLDENNLDDDSKFIYKALLKYENEFNTWKENFNLEERYNYNLSMSKRIEFSGEFADEIYKYASINGITVLSSDTSNKKLQHTFDAKDKEYKLKTYIKNVKEEVNDLNAIRVTVEGPTVYNGREYSYFIDNNCLCRCNIEDLQDLVFLFNNGYELNEISFTFGRNNIANFYKKLYPILQSHGEIIDETGIDIFNDISVYTYLFRLDYKDNIICKIYKYINDNKNKLEELDTNDSDDKKIIECIKVYFKNFDKNNNCYISDIEIEGMYFIIEKVIPYFMKLGDVEVSENIKKINKPKKAIIKIGVSVNANLIDLNVSSDDFSKDDIEEILSAYNSKEKYYKLKKGDIINLAESNLDVLEEIADTTGMTAKELLSKKRSIPIYKALYLNKIFDERIDNSVDRDETFNKLIGKFDNAKKQINTLPSSLNAKLRNYQVDGFNWIKMLDYCGFGGILADEMGLGKTLQTISFLTSIYESGEKVPSIIITPASLIYNWAEEFKKFAPKIKIKCVVGNIEERKEILNNLAGFNVLITSYDLLKRDIELYEDKIFRCEIIDEAQFVKNQSTQVTKSVKVLNSQFKIALTGTPIENNLSELWSIFDYLMPEYLNSYQKFRKAFEIPIVKDKNEEKMQKLNKMVAPFILRRVKKDVIKDLPEKLEEVYYAKMDEEQKKLYMAEVSKLKMIIASSNYEKDKLKILAEITKLRETCCDPSLLWDNYDKGSCKKDLCISLIENAISDNHKILVFSQFTSMLDLLEKELNSRNISFYKIIGSTPKEERLSLVNKFNADETKVFLISLRAGGTGLNLVGADIVIHYDPWWNVSAQNQATARAHRIGQNKIVNVYKLIVKDTIEEKILKMQMLKEDLANGILSGELGGLAKLSKDELVNLIAFE